MISLGLAGLFGCTPAPVARRDSSSAAVDEAEARFRAAIAGDPAALESLLADDFFYLTAAGTTLDKRGLIDHLRSGATRVDRIVKEDGQQVRRDGLVVTTGHSVVEVRLDGHATRLRSRHLHVWIEEAGGWRLLARQADMQRPSSD
ncbi:MAG: nuclear transport factor 2 family protein [Deltaproteobacteria bacterium]|nr:nuclear transport factor 2 family protein [Deltaproteobacteria bacterium]